MREPQTVVIDQLKERGRPDNNQLMLTSGAPLWNNSTRETNELITCIIYHYLFYLKYLFDVNKTLSYTLIGV
jgi:hypothetical protein